MIVWGITSHESRDHVSQFVEQTGLTFPVLLDTDGAVNAAYQQLMAFPTAAYPQDWIVGNDGTIVYKNNAFELDAMEQALQSQL